MWKIIIRSRVFVLDTFISLLSQLNLKKCLAIRLFRENLPPTNDSTKMGTEGTTGATGTFIGGKKVVTDNFPFPLVSQKLRAR